MTNFERIKQTSVEELARMLVNFDLAELVDIMCPHCKMYGNCVLEGDHQCTYTDIEMMKDWLSMEENDV